MDPVIKSGVLAAVERQVNQLLALDPAIVKKLSQWFAKVVALQCTAPGWTCYLHIEDDGIRLAGTSEQAADATFTGSGVAFAILAARKYPTFAEIPGLSVHGDEAFINALQQIHQQMELDWEQPLCASLGDVPGHFLAQGMRFVGEHIQRGQHLALENLGEYLQEELQLIPSRVEVEGFSAEVSELAESVELFAQAFKQKCKKELLHSHISTSQSGEQL